MSINSAAEQKFTLELTRQELQDLWTACCDGRKHKRYIMETHSARPAQSLAKIRPHLWRLQALEKRLGQALLGCQCRDCGGNPWWEILTIADGLTEPMLCERCASERENGKNGLD
jgi:hypothetical protein